MTLRPLGQSIPSNSSYPGLVARKIDETREIVILGWGEEAERVADEAVAQIQFNKEGRPA